MCKRFSGIHTVSKSTACIQCERLLCGPIKVRRFRFYNAANRVRRQDRIEFSDRNWAIRKWKEKKLLFFESGENKHTPLVSALVFNWNSLSKVARNFGEVAWFTARLVPPSSVSLCLIYSSLWNLQIGLIFYQSDCLTSPALIGLPEKKADGVCALIVFFCGGKSGSLLLSLAINRNGTRFDCFDLQKAPSLNCSECNLQWKFA